MIQLIIKILDIAFSIFSYVTAKKEEAEIKRIKLIEKLNALDIKGESLLKKLQQEQNKNPTKNWDDIS